MVNPSTPSHFEHLSLHIQKHLSQSLAVCGSLICGATCAYMHMHLWCLNLSENYVSCLSCFVVFDNMNIVYKRSKWVIIEAGPAQMEVNLYICGTNCIIWKTRLFCGLWTVWYRYRYCTGLRGFWYCASLHGPGIVKRPRLTRHLICRRGGGTIHCQRRILETSPQLLLQTILP